MEPRTIAIGLIAVVAAFGAAFGISSSGGGKTATAGPGTKAESVKVAAPAAVTGVEVGGTLPALKAEKKKAKKKKAEKPSTSDTAASAPSTNDTTPETTAPSTQNTAPPQNTAPAPSTPKPQPKPQTPSNDGPVSGGGEDG